MELFKDFNVMVLRVFMLLTASLSSSLSQPDADLKEPAEDVEGRA